jgi:type II secretory pathway component PulF
MPSFHYKAVDDAGKVVKGSATPLMNAMWSAIWSRSGLTLIQCRMLKKSTLLPWLGGSVNTRAVVEFYYRLSQTMEIGLPILSALEENSRYLPSGPMRHISGEIKVAVEGGRTLYEAMGAQPHMF